MYESKDVEMKGLSQTLLLQKLPSGAGICTLNVFTLKYGRPAPPINHMTPFLCPQAERDPTDGRQARRDAGAAGGDAACPGGALGIGL